MSIYSSESTPDLDTYAGKTGTFQFDGLDFAVTVVKARLRFGHLDLLIKPANGSGEKWVEQHRVSLKEDRVMQNVIGVIGDRKPSEFSVISSSTLATEYR